MPTPVLKNRVHTAKQQARKERIRNELTSDFQDPGSESNVDVFVLSSEEVIELWIAKQRKSGKSDDEINRRYGELSGDETFNLVKAHASNVVALARDTASLAILMRDFKRSGNVLGVCAVEAFGPRFCRNGARSNRHCFEHRRLG